MNLLKKYITMFREDMKEVMSRRCGLDELNNFIMLLGFIFVVTALFMDKRQWVFILIATALIVLCYIRVFSKNLAKRKKENDFYMRYMGNVVRFVNYLITCVKMKIRTMKDEQYAYFVCSSCGQILRIPKGKYRVSIRCPKCSKTFVKRT